MTSLLFARLSFNDNVSVPHDAIVDIQPDVPLLLRQRVVDIFQCLTDAPFHVFGTRCSLPRWGPKAKDS